MANEDNYEDEDTSRIGQHEQARLDPTGRHIVPHEPSDETSTASPDELAASELGAGASSDGSSSEAGQTDSLYNDKEDGKQSRGAAIRGGLAKRKGILLIAGGLGGIVFIVIILLFLLFSGLKLPNLLENIIGYQFARVSRSYARSGERLNDESLVRRAVKRLGIQDSAVGRTITNLNDKVAGAKDAAGAKVRGIPGVTTLIDQNDRFNPAQIQKNLNGAGLNFANDSAGKPTVTLTGAAAEKLGYPKGVVFLIEQPKAGLKGAIPGYSSFLKAKSARNLVNSDFVQSALNNAYDSNGRLRDVGPISRGLAMNSILKRLNISRTGFLIAKYKDARDAKKQAKIANEETHRVVSPKDDRVPTSGPVGEAVDKAADAEKQAQAAAEKDATGATSIRLTGDGTAIADESVTALAQAGTRSQLNKVISGLAGPVYQIAYLACIFDEGANANDNSQIIDANNDSNQRDFVQFASIADQQKTGPANNQEVDAFDAGLAANQAKIGDTTEDTAPLLRASGKAYDTSGEQAAQSTPYGFETPEKAVDNNVFWTVMTSVEPVCPAVTSLWTAGGVALANAAKDVISWGSGAAVDTGAEAAGQVAEKTVIKKVTSGIAKKISENIGKEALSTGGKRLVAKNIATKPLKLLSGFIKNGIVVAGVESLGAYMGAQRSTGLNHTGYEANATLVSQIDAGGNANAQDLCRTMQFCRPLTRDEVCQSNQDDTAYLNDSFRSQNSFQRYFATTNYQSLTSRLVIKSGSMLHGPVSKPLASLGDALTKPGSLFGSLLSPFSNRVLALTTATTGNCDSDTGFYGNVQFGWTSDEEAKIDSDPSYKPAENLGVLADAGSDKMMTIANTYARCFGKKLDDAGNLVDDPNATMGHLLTGTVDSTTSTDGTPAILQAFGNGSGGDSGIDSTLPDIERDEHGNVINDPAVRCSPINLSYQNPLYGDLVFRWRIANRDQNTQDQMSALGNATSDISNQPTNSADATAGVTADNGPTITGDTPTLAQRVLALDGKGITLSVTARNDLLAASHGDHITPGPIGDGSSGLPGCSARTPTALNPELLKVMLRIAAKYQYEIHDIISGHDCDTGQHPKGRAMDIFFIAGQPLDDSWWSSATNVATINDIGNIVHGTGSYNFGFGVGCSATSKIQSRGNLTVFTDSCGPQDEIHIDVRGAP